MELRGSLSVVYWWWILFFVALVMDIILHVFMLNIIPHVLLHLTSVSRSLCRRLQSDGVRISWYIKLSSATLEERRNRADLIEVYKMVHGLSSVPMSAFFSMLPTAVREVTLGSSWEPTAELIQDSTSFLHESWTDGTVSHKRRSTHVQDVLLMPSSAC